MADQIYLEEFLFRGRPPGSDQEPAYHIVLGVVGQDAFGKPTITTSGALTPDQAKGHGIDLPKVLAIINSSLMDENTALKATNQALARQIADLEATVSRSTPQERSPLAGL